MKNQTSQYGSYLIFDVLESFLQSAAPEISSCQSMSRGKLLVLKKFRYVLNIHGLQLLIIDYKIEIHTGYMPILVLCIIPHISSAICNLTGFCNGSGITGQPFQIKSNSQFFILIQLTLQRSAGFFLSWSWYTLRVLTSFMDSENTWIILQKKETECELISSSGNANTAPADTLHDKSTLFLEKIDVNVNI